MNFKNKLSRLIANINNGFVHRFTELKHTYNKDLEKILIMLVEQGVIICYKTDKKNKMFIIYLKFMNFKDIRQINLKIRSKVTLPFYISEYKLNSIKYKDSRCLRITSTNEGIIVNDYQRTKGGEFLLEIV